jgi:hypothetical protein
LAASAGAVFWGSATRGGEAGRGFGLESCATRAGRG